jgi:tetratricopeptide (TPR) repeat protein
MVVVLTGLLLVPVIAGAQEAKPAVDTRATAEGKGTQNADKRAEAAKKYLEGRRLEESGNYSGAVAAYKEAITLDPQSVDLRITLGALFLKNRNVIDAEAQAREAMKLDAASVDARKLLARVYLDQIMVGTSLDKEKARAAIKELEEVVRLNPNAKVEIRDQELPALTLVGELYLMLEEQDKALDAIKRVAEANSSSDKAHFQLAQLYFQKNKFREAAATARKAYDMDQKSPAYAGLLAKSLLRIGRTNEALEIYKKAIGVKNPAAKDAKKDDKKDADASDPSDSITALIGKDSPVMSPLFFDYLEALIFAGRYEEAISQIDPLLRNLRKDTPYYLNLVRMKSDALRRSGRREETVQLLEAALKGQDVSESLAVLYSLGETLEEMQQFDKAISTYEEALQSVVNPDGTAGGSEHSKQAAGVVLQRIAFAHRLAGRRDKMNETFERMKKVLGTDTPRADQLIVGTLIDEGKHKEALEAVAAAEKRFPDERSFKLYHAQAAARSGDTETANSIMKGLLKNTVEDSDIYLFWASVQLEANQLKEAEETVRKAISLEPNDLGPLVTLSSIQDRQKRYKESEATLRKALEIDPDNATVLNNLGYFLADRNERLAEAEALIRRAVNIEPTNGSFLDSLGWLLYRQNKLAEAQKYLEQAVIYQQRSATIHDHLGDLYKKTGQAEKARQKWEDALRLATEPDEIRRIKEKLGKK